MKASNTVNKTTDVAFCGLTVALLAVSSWITIPLGPVPFTLQTFVMVFALLALSAKQTLVSIGVYILMGAVGLPVFSGMRGGIGMLMGPTGGFIWGFFIAALVGLAVLRITAANKVFDAPGKKLGKGSLASSVPLAYLWRALSAAVVFIAVCYACGWAQLTFVAAYSPAQAFAVGIAPFIIIDAIKVFLAVLVAAAVKRAIPRTHATA